MFATELFGVSKILEAADTRADDELVVSGRDVLPFCKIFDKVPFDVPIVGTFAVKQQKYLLCKIYTTEIKRNIFNVKFTCCS